MPCGLCAAVPTIHSQSSQDHPESCNCKKEIKMLRPSELPIYSLDDAYSKDIPCSGTESPSILEQQIGAIRRSLQGVSSQWHVMSDTISFNVHTGMEHGRHLVEYLQEEDNTMPRLGAVVIGGLSGLILGFRGGLLKRAMYFSTGALTVGAICYPRKAQESFESAKYYANIGYNFIYGVKPGDDNRTLPDVKLSTFQIPTTLSELVDLSVGIGSAIVNVVGPLSERKRDIVNDTKEVTESVRSKDSENNEKAD